MPRRVALALALSAAAALLAPAGAPDGEWRFDVVRLRNGSSLCGVILEDTPGWVRFQSVQRRRGRATVSFTLTVPRDEVRDLERLPPAERAALRARLDAIEADGRDARERADRLELAAAPWNGLPGKALRYEADAFVLVSDAPETLVRRAAVQLERAHAAFRQFLPPRVSGARPTTVLLFRDAAAYRAELTAAGLPVLNPACYQPDPGRVLCACESARLADELEEIRRKHAQILADADRQEAELTKLFPSGRERERYLATVTDTRRQVHARNRKNDAIFERETARLFAVLFHESFHAYADRFAYPRAAGGLPRWLDEGLAQVFETAIIEGGELRLGHADPARLRRVKELARAGSLVPWAKLLKAGQAEFAVAHESERAASDRAYLTGWALAFYLAFEKRRLGTPAFDRFVAASRGPDPVAALGELLGEPASAAEAAFGRYVRELQEDGRPARLGP